MAKAIERCEQIWQQQHRQRNQKQISGDAQNLGFWLRPAGYSVFERSVERFAVHENASKYKVRASVLNSIRTDKALVATCKRRTRL
jgi:arylamine N-acetyltransferase